MCVLQAECVSVHDFHRFSALPEMMPVLCSKDSWYPNFSWLPWYLIGTNYPECVGHFLVKCSGRSQRLTLHQSREVFSVKSSDYWERCSHLGKIKRFSLLPGFSLFSPFYSGKWFPDSGKVSVSLNETSLIFFFSQCACIHFDFVKVLDLLFQSQEKWSSHQCSLSISSISAILHALLSSCPSSQFELDHLSLTLLHWPSFSIFHPSLHYSTVLDSSCQRLQCRCNGCNTIKNE